MNNKIWEIENNPIFVRRSIRKYVNKKIEKEKLDRILKAAMQAPSSGNEQPWEFLVVQNKDILKKISEASKYVKFVDTAGAVILVMSNSQHLKFDGDYWQQDLSAATQNILLQIVVEGLGGVWTGVAPDKEMMDYMVNLFDLPEKFTPFSLIAIGHMEPGQNNEYIDRFDDSRVHYDKID